jgi:thiamine kinase-like enzyme
MSKDHFDTLPAAQRETVRSASCSARLTTRVQQGWVSSHNDSIPSNILFDGDRLWLIDWESAYRNDPLVDVAIVLDP